ncbi:MAG: ABC transporter permease [Phycisphaeraceae bacterium]|nr:MAG: ABC transporter permease [Phycisphaeraceae bacterium]
MGLVGAGDGRGKPGAALPGVGRAEYSPLMGSIWQLARELWAEKARVVFAIVFALVSAFGLGAGIVALHPIMKSVLEPEVKRGLPEIAGDLNEQLAKRGIGVHIPQTWIDELPPGTFTAMVWIVGGLGVLTVIGAAANFAHQYLALSAVFRAVARIRERLFERVVHLPLGTIVTGGASDPVSRVINDTEALAQGFTSLLSKAVAQVTKGAAGLIAAFVIDWRLALAAMLVAPALAVVIRKLGKRIRRAARSALVGRAGLYRAAGESIGGMRVVKVHGTEDHETGLFNVISREVLDQQLRVRTARALASPLVEVLAMFVLGGLALVAVKLILDGHLNVEDFLLTFAALGVAGASLKPVTGLLNDIQQSSAAADRIVHLLDADIEPGHDGKPKLARHKEMVAFEGVSVTYPGADTPAIDGVSVDVKFGQTVAFVGPNGSGKTTLLSLVPRLFDPSAGRVVVDGTDIAGVDVTSLRAQIGVVTQETVLFARPLRDNIAYGMEGVSDEAIMEAVRRARAEEIVEALPDGLGTVLGEQGLTLSGGQRQRLAIARAILRDPAILILDEATSMIDAHSEALIAEAIDEFSAGRTCLIVAHRLSTVMRADSIVVLDAGRVVDRGTHAQLLERCEVYGRLAKHQLVPTGA